MVDVVVKPEGGKGEEERQEKEKAANLRKKAHLWLCNSAIGDPRKTKPLSFRIPFILLLLLSCSSSLSPLHLYDANGCRWHCAVLSPSPRPFLTWRVMA